MKTTILRTNASTGNPKPASRLLSFAKMISLLLVIFAVCSTTVSAQSLQKPDQGLDSKVKQTLKKNAETLRFMENKGQIADKNILYYFEGKNGAAYIERNKIHFVANDNEKSPVKKVNGKADTYVKGTHTFTLNLDGANSNAALQLGESFATKYNYFLGRTAKDGVTGIKAAKDLTIREVYPGIDLRLYSSAEGTLEFDWLMKPGADYSKVKLNFTGQDKLTVDQKGNLKVGLRFADVKFNIPESYQVSASGKIPVKFSFTEPEENTIAFATNSRVDPRLALVIDPVLSWGTFMDANNSNFDDYLFAIQVDPVDGMVYCAGNTQRPIPTNAAPYDADGYLNTVSGLSGGTGQSSKPSVAVVYRINSTGTDLVDLTLYGPSTVSGTNQVQAYALSLSANRVFIGGTTNVSIPTAGTPFDNGLSGTSDGYVAVFSRDLGTLTYATYLGGSGDDSRGVTSIRAIDDNSFVVGATVAAALPTSSPNYISGAAQSGFVGTGSNMYIAKFTSLNALSWGTYVGGSGTTTFNDLEILNDNRIAFCGYGTGQFSGTAGVPGEVNSAAARSTSTDEDGIIGVLNSNGSAFNYLDEIGGSANDRINDVEIVGNTLYWTGAAGNGFPISGGKYTSYSGGTSDAIVGKVDAGGSTGYVSTYYGTSGTDLGNGIRLVTQSSCDGSTSSTFLLVFGTVGASGLPTQNINNESFFNSNFTAGGNTGLDMFFAGFTSDLGTLKYGTYMGGNADDYLGATGDPRGANHLWVQGANVFLGTTTHSASHTPTLVSGGFDIGKSNTTNDTHIILGIQFASILLSDYGDAPVSYGVPAHILDNCSKLRIGALIDGEASAANSVGADGDNLNGLNDEDGISTLPLLNGGTGSYSVVVNNILNNYGSAANLYGWIDFNGDGQFQSSEFASTTVANGFSGSKTLTWTGVTVSGDASKHYLRIRLTTDNLSDNAGTTSLDERSTTQAANGEVEDYRCQEFTCPTAQTELPCQTQSAIDTKYAAWLATVRAGGGCSDGVTNNAPANAPKVGIGGTVTVKFTYTSSCGTLSSECTSTFTVQAASNIQLSSSITTPIACNGGGNATVLISATGGSTPYTGTGSFSQAPGTHTYVVSDKNGCGNSIDVTVTQPDPISFTATPVQPSCFGDKGSVTLSTPTGGTGGITFDGTATSNLAPGDYTYTATDANGCKTSHTVHINAAPSAISFTATPVQPTCFGDKGSVTLSTPTGGTGTISFDGTATTNLGEGDYTYTATDENGCKTSHTVHINAAPSAISFTATPVQPTCFGDKGSVTLSTPTGGTGTISFDGTATTNLGEGDYTYTATDENGCKTSHTVH
ncbi:MAG TPA: GEVED domain-containing protein, partial [Panacibacter sp.]|nr:GEVED domain-containing protein [Panacibacter sp.]